MKPPFATEAALCAAPNVKWCNGPCGRELPLEAFSPKGHTEAGTPQFHFACRACRRIQERDRYRGKYHRDPEFRAAELLRVAAVKAARQARRASVVAHNPVHESLSEAS
jgi:hypothetical protein